jgi:hypothetical protein
VAVETADDEENGIYGSNRVLVSGDRRRLDGPPSYGAGAPVAPGEGVRMWTGDYSNLFRILK